MWILLLVMAILQFLLEIINSSVHQINRDNLKKVHTSLAWHVSSLKRLILRTIRVWKNSSEEKFGFVRSHAVNLQTTRYNLRRSILLLKLNYVN